ncbi:hypothetical protein CEE44_00855 [Candidatus Woesearchaeota archaeon B3_Woes]|nr:MAG: hypothetical protein CEE44_00855 [Candidatus Woesearchaeota archaeon B3_Woes]
MNNKKGFFLNKSIVLISMMVLMIGMMSGSVLGAISSIQVTSPIADEDVKGVYDIEWTAIGFEGDFVDIVLGNGGWEVIQPFRGYSNSPFQWNTTSIDDGEYTILVRDSSNFEMNGFSGSFTLDNTNPIVTIDPVITPTKVNTQLITGTFTELNLDKIEVNSVVADIDGNTYSATIDLLVEGENTVTVIATDLAGNIGEASDTIILDTTGPTVSVSGAPEGWLVKQGGATATIDCITEDCVEMRFKFHDTDPTSCSGSFDTYTDTNPVIGHKWVCAAAKDSLGNIDYSSPQEFIIFDTITNAISAAEGGETINVAEGIYDEQVIIDKSLTLQGAGDTTIIQPPAVELTPTTSIPWLGGSPSSMSAIVSVETTGGIVTVKDLKIDGSLIPSKSTTWVAGLVYLETSGTIDSVTVIGNPTLPDRTAGIFAAAITNPVTLEVTECTVEVYNRAGIYALGGTMTADYNNNSINGPGNSSVGVPNGMFFLEGAKGSATYNTITDLSYTGETYRSTGIGTYNAGTDIVFSYNEISLVQNAFALAKNTVGTTVKYNDVHDCHTGVKLESGATNNIIQYNDIMNNDFAIRGGGDMGEGNVAHYNNFVGNDGTEWTWDGETYIGAVSNVHAEYILNAETNYWGCSKGPEDDACDSVSENVLYEPWAWAYDEDFNVDTTGPETEIVSPDASSLQDEAFEVSLIDSDELGQAPDTGVSGLEICKYRIRSYDGNSWPVTKNLGSRPCSEPITLSVSPEADCRNEGIDTCKIEALAIDKVGNEGDTVERTFSIDWTSPTINIDSVITPTNVNTQEITGTFTELNIDTITVNGVGADIVENTYSATIELIVEGENPVTVIATDLAENTGQASDTIVLDTTAPEITDVTGDLITVVEESIEICATITDAGSDVASAVLYYDLEGESSMTEDEVIDDKWCVNINALGEIGEITYYITTIDVVGKDTTSLGYTIKTVNFIMHLSDGWNLISIPKTLVDNTPFGNLVWTYDTQGSNWVEPTAIDPGTGYWVESNGEEVPLDYEECGVAEGCLPSETRTFFTGWNLIGHMSMDAETQLVEDAIGYVFEDNPKVIQAFLLRYDGTNFKVNNLKTRTYAFPEMTPGEGYWLYTSEEITYTN